MTLLFGLLHFHRAFSQANVTLCAFIMAIYVKIVSFHMFYLYRYMYSCIRVLKVELEILLLKCRDNDNENEIVGK